MSSHLKLSSKSVILSSKNSDEETKPDYIPPPPPKKKKKKKIGHNTLGEITVIRLRYIRL